MSEEDIAILAFLSLKGTPKLSNRNIECFIQGYRSCNNALVHKFGEVLRREGEYYLHRYKEKRIEALGYSGMYIESKHFEEFKAAEKLGELLLEASKLIQDNSILA